MLHLERAARVLVNTGVCSAYDNSFTRPKPRQDLRVDIVVDSNDHSTNRRLASGIDNPDRDFMAGTRYQRGRRDDGDLLCLVQHNIHLDRHGDTKLPVIVSDVKQAVVIDRGVGGSS